MFSFWFFSHSRFCLIYLRYLLGRSFVTMLQARTEKSAFEREADRSKVAGEQWRSHREREMGEKKLISAGVYRSETFPPPLYCEGKHMFRPVCPLFCTNVHANASRFPVSDTGVTAAFYKVRDSSARMCIRVSPPRSILSPSVTSPSIHFPWSYCLRTIRALVSQSRSRCVSIPVRYRGFARCLRNSFCSLRSSQNARIRKWIKLKWNI